MDVVVMILAGGFATRLRPLSYTKPKVLLPILDKPIIDYILEAITKLPISNVILSLRYMADLVKTHVEKNWRTLENKITYLIEDRPLGDAGPIVLANLKSLFTDTTILVINGDVFSNVDLEKVLEFHRKKGGVATVVLVEAKGDLSRFGVASLNSDSRITKFIEKPRGLVGRGFVNAGIYVFEPEIIKYLPKKLTCRLKISIDLIPKLLENCDVYGFVHRGYWFDIGTPEDYLRANIEALKYYYPNSKIDGEVDGEVISPCYVGSNVYIGKNSEIGPYTVILSGVKAEENVRISTSILLGNVLISRGTYISEAIVGEGVYIGKWVRIESGAVIGDYTYIGDYVYIGRNVRIGPHREVLESIYEENKILP